MPRRRKLIPTSRRKYYKPVRDMTTAEYREARAHREQQDETSARLVLSCLGISLGCLLLAVVYTLLSGNL